MGREFMNWCWGKRLNACAAVVAMAFICQTCGPDATGPSSSNEKGLKFTLLDADSSAIPLDSTHSFRVLVKNNGPDAATVTVLKSAITTLDSSWTASLCVGGLCRPPFIDSLDIDPAIPVGSADTCTLDVTGISASPGTAVKVNLKIYNKADPTQNYEHIFTASF